MPLSWSKGEGPGQVVSEHKVGKVVAAARHGFNLCSDVDQSLICVVPSPSFWQIAGSRSSCCPRMHFLRQLRRGLIIGEYEWWERREYRLFLYRLCISGHRRHHARCASLNMCRAKRFGNKQSNARENDDPGSARKPVDTKRPPIAGHCATWKVTSRSGALGRC
mmetsp:Transcript_18698/g.53758  ORF Transcript_18698/g.53758 Transcript_18698/m.53758 type:complete len:164 (-) Transcript_18698:184-675(-)